ncbi:MAG: hypothetical protein WAO91_05455 [Candidatus Nitrosotenuis sp.]
MTLGFGSARKYLSDPATFKLSIAGHFLKKIPKKIPESDVGRSTLEANIDSFLFFASSVIDVIKREINDEFELFDKENVFYIHGIRKCLSDSGKQKQVKKIISSYFTTPIKVNGNRWNTKQSSLWRLQILRNKVTHGHILNPADKKTINITYTIPQYRKIGDSVFGFEENIKNPHRYFAQIFEDLDEFVRKTRKILSVK